MKRPFGLATIAVAGLALVSAAPGVCSAQPAGVPAAVAESPRLPDPATRLEKYAAEPLAGFTVLFHRDLSADPTRERRVRAALLYDLETLSARIPAPALAALRAVRIVVSPSLTPRAGFSGRGMCYHADAGWLESAGFEPDRAGTVEICNADDFLQWRAEQPMMVLHELAHAFHAMLGFDRADVHDAFEAARAGGTYERVRFALAAPGQTRTAYAIGNQREYFAELSEACFGRNDYEPFTRDELERFDPRGLTVIESLWALDAPAIERERRAAVPPPPPVLAPAEPRATGAR